MFYKRFNEDISSSGVVNRFARAALPSTMALLTQGGDARLQLDAQRGCNKYGCKPYPDAAILDFGSSTASVISPHGFAAAEALRRRLVHATQVRSHASVYADELERLRGEIKTLCAVDDLPGVEVVFAASGTDLHLIAAQLCLQLDTQPLRIIMVGAEETGGGVPMALSAMHFSSSTALGDSVTFGAAMSGRTPALSRIAIRGEDGMLRSPACIDNEVSACVEQAMAQGERVMLVMVDVSKTGMIVPSVAQVAALRQRYGEQLTVLVDACQFRLAASTLRAYLQQGLLVAITGSKFVSGPSFSGALFIPPCLERRFARTPLPSVLRQYCAKGEWPRHWLTANILPNIANFGLLLRWQVALAELALFRVLPESRIDDCLSQFATAVTRRLNTDSAFALLPTPTLDRTPWCATPSWDVRQTIFPFVLYHQGRNQRTPLHSIETERIFHQAYQGDAPVRLGQPVACGRRHNIPVSALRLCVSARMVAEACSQEGGVERVIENAYLALDRIAAFVRHPARCSLRGL